MTTQQLILSRAYAVLAWLLAGLAVLHMATTWRLTTATAATKVWFFSAGLAMAQTAALNLLHRKYGRSAVALGWVTRGSNALLLAVSVVGGLATGASFAELAVVLGLLAAILVLSFIDSASQRLLLLTIMVLVGGLPVAGQQPTVKRLDGSTITSAEIDGAVTRLMGAANVTGVGIAIFNDGRIAYLKTYGARDKEKNLPLTEDSVLAAASLTKVTFAYMVMQLVEKKVLDLDRPVYQYLPKPLPEYPAYKDLADDPRFKQITARMLLSHTSGFPNLRQFNEGHKLNINFEPGSRYAYSGEGIQLLQLLIETVTNKPVQELMRDHIFQPFGMARSSMLWESRFEDDFALPYNEDGRSLGPPEQRAPANAAGSMLTTLRDFTNFMQAVISSRNLREETRDLMLSPQIKIFSKRQFPTLATATTEENKPIRLSYGLGWGLYWTPYGKAFFKEGHLDGYHSYTVCFDDQKTGIVIMTNSSNGEGIYKELLETLLKNTFTPIEWEGFIPYDKKPPRKPPKEHREVAIDPKLLDRYVGRYTIPPTIISITRDGDRLIAQQDREPLIELFPESERDFFAKIMDIWMTFETDSEGRVTALIIHTGDTDLRAKRME